MEVPRGVTGSVDSKSRPNNKIIKKKKWEPKIGQNLILYNFSPIQLCRKVEKEKKKHFLFADFFQIFIPKILILQEKLRD